MFPPGLFGDDEEEDKEESPGEDGDDPEREYGPSGSSRGAGVGDIDIEALALRVYAMLRDEVRIERERLPGRQ